MTIAVTSGSCCTQSVGTCDARNHTACPLWWLVRARRVSGGVVRVFQESIFVHRFRKFNVEAHETAADNLLLSADGLFAVGTEQSKL